MKEKYVWDFPVQFALFRTELSRRLLKLVVITTTHMPHICIGMCFLLPKLPY